jgi:predicted O-methyltransferase YrrM
MLSPYGLTRADESRYLAWCFAKKRPYFGAWFLAGLGNTIRQAALRDCAASSTAKAAPLRALEVGSWTGASACTIASTLRSIDPRATLVCVDPWRPYEASSDMASDPLHFEMNALQAAAVIRELFLHNVAACGLADAIRVERAEARAALPGHADGSFDLVYVDGNHRHSAAAFDLREAARLAAPGGIVCGDDLVLAFEDTDRAQTIENRERDYVVDRRTGQGHHPGVALAVAETFGRAAIRDGFFAVRRTANGFEPHDFDAHPRSDERPAHLRLDPDWPG